MKTINTKYLNINNLETFIQQNEIQTYDTILLQIFTGICEVEYITRVINEVKDLLPNINIIGSTTDGEIMNGNVSDNETILSFTMFEDTKVVTHYIENQSSSYESAKRLIEQFDHSLSPKVAISFVDGINTNGEDYLHAFEDYDRDLVVAGGLAGDNATFTQTIVFTQDKVLTSGVVVALLYNDNLVVNTAANFGWDSIGKTLTVTSSNNNIVYEIDGMSAVDLYAKYLGEDIAKQLPKTGIEFPLIIKKDSLNIARAVVGKNSDGSLVFAGNLSVGDKVTFGYGNLENIIQGGGEIFDDIASNAPESIFIYSCMARKALMQDDIVIELQLLNSITNISGFFTYGEFYSNCKKREHELLNQTMTILALSEKQTKQDYKTCPINIQSQKKNYHTLKALSHLISQTSLELEEINASLEKKVSLEVERSAQKDKQMLEQSRLAQMGEMMSMIAHQWRQPLAAISSTSGTINIQAQLNTLNNKSAIDLTNDISEYTQHLSSTIDDFRDFFKPDKDRQYTTFDELITNALNIVKTSISTNHIELILELECKNRFATYPNEIKQVILNLIKNAEDILLEKKIKNPYIRIHTYSQGTDSILEVTDNGGGIADNIIEYIFDPYYSTKLEKNGTGLGLYMSKTIIEEHCDGILSVANSSDGATFKIILKEISNG